MKKEHWPFDQSRDCAVITTKEIISRERPILFVSHDEDDHGWQFLTGGTVRREDAAVVALHEIVQLDPTVLALADLPPGWIARRRSANLGRERRSR